MKKSEKVADVLESETQSTIDEWVRRAGSEANLHESDAAPRSLSLLRMLSPESNRLF
jgi:hypothetical protein